MWSRKFYHIFDELSTEVIRGICEDKGECATFGAVEPFWCFSFQIKRPTNWATPGFRSPIASGTRGIIHDAFQKSNHKIAEPPGKIPMRNGRFYLPEHSKMVDCTNCTALFCVFARIDGMTAMC